MRGGGSGMRNGDARKARGEQGRHTQAVLTNTYPSSGLSTTNRTDSSSRVEGKCRNGMNER